MNKKQIVPCAICANPQTADVEKFYSTIAKATKTTIEVVRLINYRFICHACSETATYRNDYYSSKGKPHAVLTKEAAIVNH